VTGIDSPSGGKKQREGIFPEIRLDAQKRKISRGFWLYALSS